jgi:hypothetical protein
MTRSAHLSLVHKIKLLVGEKLGMSTFEFLVYVNPPVALLSLFVMRYFVQ